jgi:23S rRNA (cytidine2498-2'-O)-methyltransferase
MNITAPAAISTAQSTALAWLAYCRPGFERDLAEELQARFHCEATLAVESSGFVIAPGARLKTLSETSVATLTFARQLVLTTAVPVTLTSNDRVNPILEALITFMAANQIAAVTDCWIEYPDTNDGKALSRAAKAIEPRLREALIADNKIVGHAKYRAHIFLTPNKEAWVGLADMNLATPDFLGIPRIRMPHDAPSRSTLKLAEAFHVFLADNELTALQADMRAVDLGAAPGGWTWQLINRGIRVTAIDNGDLKGDLVDNAMVKHMRLDGFKYQPNVPVDWMVCDMVESPSRIANLVAKWLTQGWARYIIFNLKLPMKKRAGEVLRCEQIIGEACEEAGVPLVLQLKQLYHDREEVTGFATIPTKRSQFAHNRAAVAKASDKVKRDAAIKREKSPTDVATKLPPRKITGTSPWSAKPAPKSGAKTKAKQKRRTSS